MFKSSFASCAKLWEVTYAAALSKKCLSFMLGRQWVCTWCAKHVQSGFLLWKPICVLAFITVRVLLVICLLGKSLLLKCLYFCEMFTCEMLTFAKCLLAHTCEMLLLWNVYLCTCEIFTCDTLTFVNAYLCTCELLTCERFTCEMLTCVYLWTFYLWNVYLCESFHMVLKISIV